MRRRSGNGVQLWVGKMAQLRNVESTAYKTVFTMLPDSLITPWGTLVLSRIDRFCKHTDYAFTQSFFKQIDVGLEAVRSTMEFSQLSSAEQMAIEDMIQIL